MDSKISFPERIKRLKQAAECVRDIANTRQEVIDDLAEELREAADVVMTEVLHMEAAEQRFAARKGERRQTTRASR